MKRLHLHVSVDDLPTAVRFYGALFAAPPSVEKPDYAKWMLEDPRVNFAISVRGHAPGLDHVGIQVETPEELTEVYARLRAADAPMIEEGATTCCYAKSEKSWATDPAGLSWETFLTTGESTVYGEGLAGRNATRVTPAASPAAAGACCAPVAPTASACCGPAA